MRIASRMRPELRKRHPGFSGAVIAWDHSGVTVDSFILEIDGVEYNLGPKSPDSGTTYTTPWPEAVASGTRAVAVYAVNTDGRTTSVVASLVKP